MDIKQQRTAAQACSRRTTPAEQTRGTVVVGQQSATKHFQTGSAAA